MMSIYRHSHGNHSEYQVRSHGRLLFSGSNRDALKFLADLRRRARQKFYEACSTLSLSQFIESELAEIFVFYDQ